MTCVQQEIVRKYKEKKATDGMEALPEITFLAHKFNGNDQLLQRAIDAGEVTRYKGKDGRWWCGHGIMAASETVVNRSGQEWSGKAKQSDSALTQFIQFICIYFLCVFIEWSQKRIRMKVS